jgi:hypothetical protein
MKTYILAVAVVLALAVLVVSRLNADLAEHRVNPCTYRGQMLEGQYGTAHVCTADEVAH